MHLNKLKKTLSVVFLTIFFASSLLAIWLANALIYKSELVFCSVQDHFTAQFPILVKDEKTSEDGEKKKGFVSGIFLHIRDSNVTISINSAIKSTPLRSLVLSIHIPRSPPISIV